MRIRSPYSRANLTLTMTLPVLLFPIVVSCSFDYSDAAVEASRTEEIPQVEITNARMVVQRENRLELTAARIATYRDRRVQEFSDLVFREYGPDGHIRLEGFADEGTLFLDSEDVELLGTVRFYSQVEGARLESSFLYWDNADRVLRGEPDGAVRIVRDDGSLVEGAGLRVDGRRNSVELTSGVSGVYVGEDESP
jgi:LPS export ABC transporter protein LptC